MQGPLPLELLSFNHSIQLYRSFIKAIKKKKERKEKLPSLQWAAKKTHSGSNIGGNHLHAKYPGALCTWLIFLPWSKFTNVGACGGLRMGKANGSLRHCRFTMPDKGLRGTRETREEVADVSMARMLGEAVVGSQRPLQDAIHALFLMEWGEELYGTGEEKVHFIQRRKAHSSDVSTPH